MNDRFYMACYRDNVGSNVGFHAIDGKGYTTDVRKAHVYTLEEAQRAWEHGRDIDQPLSADHIDKNIVWKVDHQYVPCETTINSSTLTKYVAYKMNRWDGNDLYFITNDELLVHSTNFSLSKIMCNPEKDSTYISISYELAKEVARPTFLMANVNNRTMVTGAGLRQPDHVKRSKRRKPDNR